MSFQFRNTFLISYFLSTYHRFICKIDKNRIIYFKIFVIWKKFTDFHQSGEKIKVRGKQGNLLMVCHQSIKRIDCILSEAEIAFFDALILRNVCECLPTRLTHGLQPYQWKWQKSDPFLPQKNIHICLKQLLILICT